MAMDLSELEPVIQCCMRDGQIPGLAVGIVTGDDIACRGFGYRDLARQLPVTVHSRFGVQSCTKAFTATVAGLLVDRGVLDWDRPLREYVPAFRLFDPVAGAQATMRDLLSHRTGMPHGGHDWLRVATDVPRQAYLDRVPFLQPSHPFRSVFQYSNLMYIVAGAIIERLGEMRWETMVRHWLFTPLGMLDSGFVDEPDGRDDSVIDYVGTAAAWTPAEAGYSPKLRDTLTGADAGPCGAIAASVHDLCRWLRCHLRTASPSLLTAATLRELHAAQIPCASPLCAAEVEDDGCAMGWFTQRYRGHRLVAYWGGAAGPTLAAFLPDDGVGVIVRSTRAASSFHAVNAIALSACDRMLGLEAIPWHVRWREAMQMAAPTPTPAPTPPPCTDSSLPGAYHHPGYGAIIIEAGAEGCVLRYGVLTFRLSRADAETVALTLTGKVPGILADWWGTRRMTVRTNAQGVVEAIEVPFEPAVADIVFLRSAA